MVRLACAIALTVGCGGGDSSRSITMTTSFVVSESSGANPSHLDALIGQTVNLEVTFEKPIAGTGMTGGCPSTELTQQAPTLVATGPSAPVVQTEVFDYLPDWYMRLALCDVAAQSSVRLTAYDFVIGCIGLPASAFESDEGGFPRWTAFTAPSCTFTLLDFATNRILGARDFSLVVDI